MGVSVARSVSSAIAFFAYFSSPVARYARPSAVGLGPEPWMTDHVAIHVASASRV